MNLEDIIAVDFGSTNSAVFVFKYGRCEQLANNDTSGEYQFPSFVEYAKSSVITGLSAKRNLGRKNHYVVSCVKRLIGLKYEDYEQLEDKNIFGCDVVRGSDDYPQFVVSEEGRQVGCIEVASELFKTIKREAERFCGHPISYVYLTVPVQYNEVQTNAIKEASLLAGLEIVKMIHEPTAAALSWCMDHRAEVRPNERMLIFDFGGGTFDVSCLECQDASHFRVCKHDGEPRLGGNDVDTALVNYSLNRYKKLTGTELFDPKLPKNKTKLTKLRSMCEDIKRNLSVSMTQDLDMGDINGNEPIQITAMDLKEAIRDLIQKTIDCVKRITDEDGFNPGYIRHVFFVGGSSNLRAVREEVMKMFQNSNFPDVNPYSCVAKGAANMAIADNQTGGNTVALQEIIQESYGIGGEDKVLILLRASQTIPCDSSAVTVELTDKTATAIQSTVYQWSGKVTEETRLMKDITECTPLSEFSIPVPSSTDRYELLLHMEVGGRMEVICRKKISKEIVGRHTFTID